MFFKRCKTTNLRVILQFLRFFTMVSVSMENFVLVPLIGVYIRIQMKFEGGPKRILRRITSSLKMMLHQIYLESLPSSPAVEKEPPPTIVEWLFNSLSELDPSSPPNVKEDQLDLVVPDTPEDVIASRAKLNPKKCI